MTIIQTSTPGPQGPAGNTIWPTTGTPANTLGANGDFANDTTNSVMYGPKAGGAWPAGISYKGGNGTSGNTMWSTTGAPLSSLGVNGDFANDSTNSVMYGPKASGAWPSGISYKGSQGPQGLPGANARWVTGTQYIGLVGTRGKAPSAVSTTVKSHMARTIMEARDNITQIGALFANWYASLSAVGEGPVGGDCTITASVEYPLGTTIHRLTFGGLSSGIARDFSTLKSDLITLSIPNGAQFAIREYRIYSGSGGVVFSANGTGIAPNITLGDCYVYTGATDLTGAVGTFTSTDSLTFSPPLGAYGPTVNPSYAIFGDSRAEGFNDNAASNEYVGNVARSVGPKRAFTNLAVSGETAAIAAGTQFSHRTAIARNFCSHVICEYGINDIDTNSTLPDALISLIETVRNRVPGQYFWQNTLEPGGGTTTDSWATVGNQTAGSKNGNRVWFNNYLRGGVTFFDGVNDVNSVVENTLNSGKWNAPGQTTDGVHETPTAYQAVATAGVVQVQ